IIGKEVTATNKLKLLEIGETIEIKMVDATLWQLIGLNQGIGRAFNRTGMAQSTQDTAAQGGLARPQPTFAIEPAAPCQRLAQPFAESDLTLLILQPYAHHRSSAPQWSPATQPGLTRIRA